MYILDTYQPTLGTPPNRFVAGAKELKVDNFTRTQYGELRTTSDVGARIYKIAAALVDTAVTLGHLPRAYDDLAWDKRGRASGDARHLEIYDCSPDLDRVLVCARETAGTKYGVATISKNYFVVTAGALGVSVVGADKHTAAKLAKNADSLGDALIHLAAKRGA